MSISNLGQTCRCASRPHLGFKPTFPVSGTWCSKKHVCGFLIILWTLLESQTQVSYTYFPFTKFFPSSSLWNTLKNYKFYIISITTSFLVDLYILCIEVSVFHYSFHCANYYCLLYSFRFCADKYIFLLH